MGGTGEEQVHAPQECLRLRARLHAELAGERVELTEARGANAGGVPAVGVLRVDEQRAILAGAADPDREALLHRGGQAGCLDRAVVLPIVGGAVLGEEAPDQRERLLEPVEALAERREFVAVGLGLGLVPRAEESRVGEGWGSTCRSRWSPYY